MPAISVVIPTYNSAAYLPQTLDAIFRQAFTDYEIIVVDDCSTDNTRELMQAASDPRVRYIRLAERHGGPSRPRNVGVKAARADIISFFDSGNIMLPGMLAPERALLKAYPTVGFVFTNAERFANESGERLGAFLDTHDAFNSLARRKTAIPDAVTISSHDAYEGLLRGNFVLSGGTVPRRVLADVGLFDEQLMNADDWDMWLRISRNYDVGYVDRIGFRYRVRSGSASSRGVSPALNRVVVVEK